VTTKIHPFRTGGKLHTCSVCGKVEQWGPSWSWYGSWADIDNGRKVAKYCSPECQDKGGHR
jgi:hypothetical protein